MGLGLFGGGAAAVRYFAARGWRVTVTDLKPAEALAASLKDIQGLPVVLHLGRHEPADFTETDLVVVNPAVPPRSPYLAMAAQAGVPLTSEMNLFFERSRAPIVGVTGTSGKSTVTTLLGDMLARAMPARVGGNIGRSLLEEADAIGPGETVVLELSSFQLHDLGRLRRSPHVAVVTGFSENHIDWHGSMEAYRDAKKNILRFQGPGDLAVLNADDPEVRSWRAETRGRAILVSAAGSPEADVRADGSAAVFSGDGRDERLDLAGRLRLRGRHNLGNALLAAAAARALGVSLEMIGAAVEALRPLPHRLQTVGRLGRILFVDDSKATTPASARAALESFGEPVVLIAGGYDKKTNPGPMVEAALARAKAVILMGETAPALAAAFGDRGPPVHRAGGIEDAVGRAVGLAASGDVVLLAPGHASWDMFDNYEQRGDAFRRAAEALGMTPASAECEVRSAE